MKGKARIEEGEDFKAFWAIWKPHMRQTDGRGLARDTFYKHVGFGASSDDIIDGAKFFIRTLKDASFIPLASTWMNRESYTDLADEERAYQRRLQERQTQPTNVVRIAALPAHHFLNRSA